MDLNEVLQQAIRHAVRKAYCEGYSQALEDCKQSLQKIDLDTFTEPSPTIAILIGHIIDSGEDFLQADLKAWEAEASQQEFSPPPIDPPQLY